MNRNTLLAAAMFAQASPLLAVESYPADQTSPASASGYGSPFESYRQAREEPLADWRAVNEEVARIGGHIGIMRGAAQPAAGPSSITPAPATTQPKPAGAGHRH